MSVSYEQGTPVHNALATEQANCCRTFGLSVLGMHCVCMCVRPTHSQTHTHTHTRIHTHTHTHTQTHTHTHTHTHRAGRREGFSVISVRHRTRYHSHLLPRVGVLVRCRVNMAQIRQSKPDYVLGFQVKDPRPFQGVPSSSEGGGVKKRGLRADGTSGWLHGTGGQEGLSMLGALHPLATCTCFPVWGSRSP